jgi:hypothetical protein
MALAIPAEVSAALNALKPVLTSLAEAARGLSAGAARAAGAALGAATPALGLAGGAARAGLGAAASGAAVVGGAALQGAAVGSGAALLTVGGAAQDAAGHLNLIVATASKFVEALNPSLVEAMGLAFRDLSAVIGVALTPIIEVAVEAFREIGAVLLPVMQELAPVIRQIADLAKAALMPVVSLVAQLLSQAAGLFQLLAPILEAAVSIFRVLVAVVSAVMDALVKAITGLVGGDLKSAADSLREAMNKLVRAVVVAVGALASFFGIGEQFVRSLENRGPRQDATGLAAVQNTRVTDIAAISRDLQAAAAQASGTLGEDDKPKGKDPVAEGLEYVKSIKGMLERAALTELIAAGIQLAASQTAGAAADALYRGPNSALSGLGTIFNDLFEGGLFGGGGEGRRRRPARRGPNGRWE